MVKGAGEVDGRHKILDKRQKIKDKRGELTYQGF